MSWPSLAGAERPCPRRSWAMTRQPCRRKNSIWVSQPPPESGQPWLKTTGWPEPRSLVEDLRAIGRRDRAHALPPLAWALTPERPHRQASHLSVSTPGHPATAAVNPPDRHPI